MIFAFWLAVIFHSHAQPIISNLWQVRLPDQQAVTSSPAIAPDGTIYQATFTGQLLAVTPDGAIKWTFNAGREIKSSPAIAADGTIYFGSRDWKFYAVTPTGKLKWTFATGAWVDSSPAIATDGTIYFGSWDSNFYALNPDGSLKWKFASGGIIDSSPAIAIDGTIYFGSHDRKLYAIKPDGSLRWTFITGGQIISSPAIESDGEIYFTSTDGNLYSLHPDGSERWRQHTDGNTASSPVLDENGNIAVSANHLNTFVDNNGKRLWIWGVGVPVQEAPLALADGTVCFSAPWRRLLTMRDGKIEWQTPTERNLSTSPVMDSHGRIYFSDEIYLRAVQPSNAVTVAKSSWPMFRANPQHNGRAQNVK